MRDGAGKPAHPEQFSGCAAAGDTKEETRRNFQDALTAHFEAMREVGEPIPEPNASGFHLLNAAGPHPNTAKIGYSAARTGG